MQKGLELCEKVQPDLLLGTDPDCDRCGAAVPDAKGGYRLISGNEMGVILLDYHLPAAVIASGKMPQKPVAVTTIVSTDMVDAVAEHYGVELRRVLTGFKFIGEQIGHARSGRASRRPLSSSASRRATAISPARMCATRMRVNAVASDYARLRHITRSKGMNLGDAIDSLYETFGYYRNDLCSFTFEGVVRHADDEKSHGAVCAQNKPAELAGWKVLSSVDYENDDTGLPKAQVLEYRLDGKAKLIVRPSGTEPKIKVYLSAVGKTKEEADAVIETMKRTANELMKA